MAVSHMLDSLMQRCCIESQQCLVFAQLKCFSSVLRSVLAVSQTAAFSHRVWPQWPTVSIWGNILLVECSKRYNKIIKMCFSSIRHFSFVVSSARLLADIYNIPYSEEVKRILNVSIWVYFFFYLCATWMKFLNNFLMFCCWIILRNFPTRLFQVF